MALIGRFNSYDCQLKTNHDQKISVILYYFKVLFILQCLFLFQRTKLVADFLYLFHINLEDIYL